MAHVLAIVSKSAFEALTPPDGRLEPGVTLPLDRYVSKHRGLQPLAGGGSLHLVTVRPGDVLWLVAVLHHPRFVDDHWEAEANTVPVRDLTALVPALRFENGQGVKAAPGKLAMSLQTPRTLADEDVVRIGAVATPTPASAFAAAMVDTLGGTGGGKPKRSRPKQAAEPSVSEAPPWREALADGATWRTLTAAARREVVEAVAGEISTPADPFVPTGASCGSDGLGVLRHEPTGAEMVLVPGGTFAMGFTVDDVLSVWGATAIDEDDDPEVHVLTVRAARPPRAVAVAPFLLARRLGAPDTGLPPGFRLPTEAEWEWVAREGGRVRFVGVPPDRHPLRPSLVPPAQEENGWGVLDLLNAEQACTGGAARMGHTWFQSESEVVALHAAARLVGVAGTPRLARDLPTRPQAPVVRWEETAAETLEALAGRPKIRELALRALETASGVAGPDLEIVADAVLADRIDPKLVPRVLGAVASVVRPGPKVEALLAHPDPKVRAAAALVLSAGEDDRALAAAAATEKKPVVLAALLLARATVSARTGAETAASERASSHRDPVVRAAAAIGAALARGAGALDRAEVLALAEATAVRDVPEVAFRGGRLAGWAAELLDGAGPEARADAARALCAVGTASALDTALRLVFPAWDGTGEEIGDPAGWSAVQREVATATSTGAPVEKDLRFSSYRLPGALRDRRVMLGLDPPGAADRLVEGRSGPVPFWRWFGAEAEAGWSDPTDGWKERIRAWMAAQPPVWRLRLFLEGERFGQPFPDHLFDPLQGVVAAARDADPAATREAIALAVGRPVGLRAAVAGLRPGEWLDEAWWPGPASDPDLLRAGLPGVPPDRREALVLAAIATPLAAARAEPFGQHGWRLVNALKQSLGLVPTAAVVADLLRLALSANETTAVLAAAKPLAEGDPAIAEVVRRYRALGEPDDEAAYRRIFGPW